MARQFQVDGDTLAAIILTASRHMRALNEDLTNAYPDAPDAAFTVALGAVLATTLRSFSGTDTKATMVVGINRTLEQLGQSSRLTPIA
jgi:hypothetical protein